MWRLVIGAMLAAPALVGGGGAAASVEDGGWAAAGWRPLTAAEAPAAAEAVDDGSGAGLDGGWAAPATGDWGGVAGGLTAEDRQAIGRIVYAEAGNQGEEGMVAVIFTILNRVNSGLFQSTVQGVIDAPNQFEPATRAGSWRYLRPLDPGRAAYVDQLLDRIVAGEIADPTAGALYFQNVQVVAARAARGVGSAYLVDFGGTPPVAVIGDHSFYDAQAGINLAAARQRASAAAYVAPDEAAYVDPNAGIASADVVAPADLGDADAANANQLAPRIDWVHYTPEALIAANDDRLAGATW